MTAEEFTSTSIALLRSAVGWQSAIARRLDVDSRSVRRWLHDDAVPDWAAEKLAGMIGARELSPWPRDEWVVGDGVTADGRAREYIVHIQPPRFVARIVAVDEDGEPMPEESPADVVSGVVYSANDLLICEIEWIDEMAPGEAVKWLEAACDAIDEMGERAASG